MIPCERNTKTSTEKGNFRSQILECTSIARYWNIPVSVDTGTKLVCQYRSILEHFLVFQYRSILEHFSVLVSSDTRTFTVPVSADTGTFCPVLPDTGTVNVPVSPNTGTICTSIARFWNGKLFQYRSILEHLIVPVSLIII